MYERVLLTTDGSPLSRAAIAHAARLVDRTHGEIRVLAVTDELPRFPAQAASVDPTQRGHRGLTDQMAAELTAGPQAHAETFKTALAAAGVERTTAEIASGRAGATIVERARMHGCDAVVMATHGRSGLARTLLGSVADHVVAHLHDVPVLLIRPSAEEEASLSEPAWSATTVPALATQAPYRRVLVGLDGTAFALHVLPAAARAVDPDTGRLDLVQVIDALPRAARGNAGDERGERATSLAEREAAAAYDRAREYLAAARERALAAGASSVETDVRAGEPEETLVELARAEGVDLVAMTTHGRSGVSRSLLGSVPNAVLRHLAGTPLLLLHPRG